jgi:protocatechuate 3,4-dioxygenase alpha subunit
MSLQATTWQTVGPFFSIGLERLFEADLAGEGVLGERIAVQGRVLDGDGIPIPDAVIEIWQANVHGKYAHPADTQDKQLEQGFRGFGRIPTDLAGAFRFTTIKPGAVPGPNGKAQAPHLVIGLLMRGLLRGLVTRAYFPDEPLLATDTILQLVEPARRATLMLQRSPEHANLFTWDIRMQGEGETVFLEF